MPLDPHAKRFLDIVATGGVPEVSGLTPTEMRQAMLRLSQAVDVRGVPMGKVEDYQLPGGGGSLRVRAYTPQSQLSSVSAGIVYFHGGAGVFSSIETQDGFCRMLANAAECRLHSVDYRLAPEHKFPAAVEDSFEATRWIAEHASELGIDPERLAVGGDSAGGTFATVVCMLAKAQGGPRIALQALFCPVTDVTAETESRKAFGQRYFLDLSTIAWALGHYCHPGTDLRDPCISPLHAPDLSGLPPAHIHTAEFDPLRDEGKAYAERLEDAGVTVRYTCHDGMIHNFYAMAGAMPKAKPAVAAAGAAIKEALNGTAA